MSNKIRNTILVISALFILAGTALYLFRLPFTVYIFAAGAVGMTVARATNLYNGSNFRLKRLYRIELIAAIVTVGSACFNEPRLFSLFEIRKYYSATTSNGISTLTSL